ncbi:Ldh: L-lactate dehydrogenase [Desulfosarcina variabilis str. Montpellier]|uniref:L-lactate dehydrogenase n=1 Tax=Desulfosarcina variabilis TaxID=2300 RepID=UPI003AFB25CF
MIQKRTVGIIGTGNVGMAAAYATFIRQTAGELILVDKDSYRAEGEAMDLMHGQPYIGNISVRAGDYPDLEKAQVIVIAAGIAQRSGEKRTDLIIRNVKIFREIANQLDKYAPNAIIIVASNPVDILSYAVQELTDRPIQKVIGTGTMLDTARFRSLLGKHYGVDPRSVHAYIIGEHGDTEVPLWSSALIGSLPIYDNIVLGKAFDNVKMDRLFERVRDAAYDIIDRKGYTNTAIGIVISDLVGAIIEDQKRVLTVSSRLNGEYGQGDVCLSLPCVVGLNGVEAKILPKLNAVEMKGLKESADFLRHNTDRLASFFE